MKRIAPLSSAALFALLALAVPVARGQAEREAFMIGSSSVGGALGHRFEAELREVDVELVRRVHTSAGFARPDYFDLENELALLPAIYRYEAVFLYVGGNDTQQLYLRRSERLPGETGHWIRWSDERRWNEVYVARVRNAVQRLCAGGARRVIVVLPINGGRSRWSSRIGRVRLAQAQATYGTRCGVVVDAGGEVYESHDGVHLTREGAAELWGRIGPRVRSLLD